MATERERELEKALWVAKAGDMTATAEAWEVAFYAERGRVKELEAAIAEHRRRNLPEMRPGVVAQADGRLWAALGSGGRESGEGDRG